MHHPAQEMTTHKVNIECLRRLVSCTRMLQVPWYRASSYARNDNTQGERDVNVQFVVLLYISFRFLKPTTPTPERTSPTSKKCKKSTISTARNFTGVSLEYADKAVTLPVNNARASTSRKAGGQALGEPSIAMYPEGSAPHVTSLNRSEHNRCVCGVKVRNKCGQRTTPSTSNWCARCHPLAAGECTLDRFHLARGRRYASERFARVAALQSWEWKCRLPRSSTHSHVARGQTSHSYSPNFFAVGKQRRCQPAAESLKLVRLGRGRGGTPWHPRSSGGGGGPSRALRVGFPAVPKRRAEKADDRHREPLRALVHRPSCGSERDARRSHLDAPSREGRPPRDIRGQCAAPAVPTVRRRLSYPKQNTAVFFLLLSPIPVWEMLSTTSISRETNKQGASI